MVREKSNKKFMQERRWFDSAWGKELFVCVKIFFVL